MKTENLYNHSWFIFFDAGIETNKNTDAYPG